MARIAFAIVLLFATATALADDPPLQIRCFGVPSEFKITPQDEADIVAFLKLL